MTFPNGAGLRGVASGSTSAVGVRSAASWGAGRLTFAVRAITNMARTANSE